MKKITPLKLASIAVALAAFYLASEVLTGGVATMAIAAGTGLLGTILPEFGKAKSAAKPEVKS